VGEGFPVLRVGYLRITDPQYRQRDGTLGNNTEISCDCGSISQSVNGNIILKLFIF